MKRGTFLLCVLISLAFVGCGHDESDPLDTRLVTVTIVYQGNVHEVGNVDDYTIVEYPNGLRGQRFYHWGEVGDRFRMTRPRYYKGPSE